MNASGNHGIQLERRTSAGVTLVELMVALAIGSFLIIGAVQIATQSRHAFRVNESIARVQETAQFVMDTLESDLRMASNWGMLSRSDAVEGRSLPADADPLDLLPTSGAIVDDCGLDWSLDLGNPIEGSNNDDPFPCDTTTHGEQSKSDTLTVRRTSIEPPAALVAGRLYVQSTRTKGQVFDGQDGVPPGFTSPTADTESHALLVNTYYVAPDSALIPGVPTLRRKTLTEVGNVAVMQDQEVAPGVENLQVQLGLDVDLDGAVDRYVNPGDPLLDDPSNRVMTARIWLVVRAIDPEIGIVDDRTYTPADVNLGQPDDQYRRLQVSKTILLRNARS